MNRNPIKPPSNGAALTHQQVAEVFYYRDGVKLTTRTIQLIERRALNKLLIAMAAMQRQGGKAA